MAHKKSRLQRASNVLDAAFGGKVIGQAIGTQIAKRIVPKNQRKFVSKGPSKKAVAKGVGKAALQLTVLGKSPKIIGATIKGIKAAKKSMPLVKRIGGKIAVRKPGTNSFKRLGARMSPGEKANRTTRTFRLRRKGR